VPLPDHLQRELSAKREAESRRARRDTWRDIALTCVQVIFWCVVGLGALLTSFHVHDDLIGRMLFWGGLAVGNGGMLFTLLAAYRRGEARGDW
jgi:hypothetical protein